MAKEKTVPIRFNKELYGWLKDYAQRKHSNMSAVITRLLVTEKETDEVNQSQHPVLQRRKQIRSSQKK